MKLKEIFKSMTKYIMIIVVSAFFLVTGVNAASAPSTIKVDYKTWNSTPVSFPINFHIKYVTDSNKFVYCLTYIKDVPDGIKYSLGKEITDPGINYILTQGANNDTNSKYFITQSALWIYMQEEGLMTYSKNVNSLIKNVNNSSSSAAKTIKNLVAEAKKAKSTDSTLTLSTDTNTLTFSISSDKKYYVSNTVKVTSNSDYTVSIDNAPKNTVKENVTGGFIIKVPVSSISNLSTSINVSVSSSKTIYHSYEYKPSNSSYQEISYTYPENLSKKVSLKGTIATTQVTISKIDVATGQELPGATLNLNCNNGEYVKEWVSGTEPVVLTDVPEGTCALTEIQAPNGYVTSTETITFKVVAGKATTKQVMKNAKEEEKTFDVEISKVSITDSSELEGADLEITNEAGQVVCSWTSDGTVHTCKNLPAGTYTLTELSAPDGYEKAESITFTLDENGNLYQGNEKVDKITMVDDVTPTVVTEVPNTLSLKSSMTYIIGLSVIVAGMSIIVKMIKKNEQ